MGCDPLSQAHLGFFTCSGTNCNPCTISNLGFFVTGDGESLKDKGAGGKRGKGRYSKERINQLLEWRSSNKELKTINDNNKSLNIERVPIVKVKRLPIPMDAPSLGDIKDDLIRDIARELRYQAIQEHARLVREEIEETRKLDEEILLIIVASNL